MTDSKTPRDAATAPGRTWTEAEIADFEAELARLQVRRLTWLAAHPEEVGTR